MQETYLVNFEKIFTDKNATSESISSHCESIKDVPNIKEFFCFQGTCTNENAS